MRMTVGRSTGSTRLLVENSASEATSLAAELFKSMVCEAVSDRGLCNIALSGGTTPHELYQVLAESCATDELPWQEVDVYFGDERNVPQDHVESNFRMVQETLLDHVPVSPGSVHPMPADEEDLSAAAAEYEALIRSEVPADEKTNLPVFDLVLLGMGGDGHVASLFPGIEALEEQKKLISACYVPVLGRQRMTFTFPLINAARAVLLLITGGDKAEAAAQLLGEDQAVRQKLPAARVSPKGTYLVVLDAAAAKFTGRKPNADA